jgi:SAM-dependent methyltransferase
MEGGVDTIVEIGPGGGRATQILLKYCRKELIACDVARKMLDLIRKRFEGEPKIKCVKLTVGKGLSELQARNADVIFSFDVFVHIDPHDIYEYVRTFNDVLRPGGIAIIHHSVIETDRGWLRFLDDHPYCMNTRKPYCAFSVMTGEIMKIFVERAGFQLVQQIGAFRPEAGSPHAIVTVFRKPLAS